MVLDITVKFITLVYSPLGWVLPALAAILKSTVLLVLSASSTSLIPVLVYNGKPL